MKTTIIEKEKMLITDGNELPAIQNQITNTTRELKVDNV
jgi:hypothetical protein